MEVEDSPQILPAVDQKVHVAFILWKAINAPANRILSEMLKSEIRPCLLAFLESMGRSSGNYTTILIPPIGVGNKFDAIRNRYAAFTNWLFGAVFSVACHMKEKVLEYSIEVQSSMLRVLAEHNLTGFESVVDKYLMILDEILEFDEVKQNKNNISINNFAVNPDAIEDMNLLAYPVTLEKKSIASTQILIMKIIIKSNAVLWNQDKLWPRLLQVLQKSEPAVKLEVIKIVTEILEFGHIERKRIEILINYITEIIRNINNWKNETIQSAEAIAQFSNLLINLLKHLETSPQVIHLCFAILDLLSDGKIVSKFLEEKTCEKIRDELIDHPQSYTATDAPKFIKYLRQCPEFCKVLNHYIVYEMQSIVPGVLIDLTEFSQLWKLFCNFLNEKIESTDISRVPNLFNAPRNLSNWMVQNKIEARLFKDPNKILESLLKILEIGDGKKTADVYLCFVEMLAIHDFNRNELQKIMALPWLSEKSEAALQVNAQLYAMAKSLPIDVKKKVLTSVCKYGEGKFRIRYLSMCVANIKSELGVTAVLNSFYLLQDPTVSFVEISIHVLKPALTGQRPPLQEAVAKVLGPIVCFLSQQASIEKTLWDLSTTDWNINCKICDCTTNSIQVPKKFPIEENIFAGYFALLSSNSPQIRENMSNNIVRLSNHLEIFSYNKISQIWLGHLRDPNIAVRNNLCKSIVTLIKNKIALAMKDEEDTEKNFQDELPEELKIFIECLIEKLSDTLHDALENSNEALHMTLLNTAKELAKLQLDAAERRICNIFIISIIHSKSSDNTVAAATIAYKEVAEISGLTPKELYLRYRKENVELMIRLAAKNFLEMSYNISTSLNKLHQCMGFYGSRDFLQKEGHLAVSYLVPMVLVVPEIEKLFAEITYATSLNEKMFEMYFQYIFVHVFLNETPENGAKCLQLISKITNQSLYELMRKSYTGLFRELLVHFYDKKEKVLTCLAIISEFASNSPDKKPLDSDEKVALYLKPYLHGALVKFDANLGPLADQSTQKATLASLGSLMKYMGPEHLSPLRFKILTSLRTSLNLTRPGFRKICCYAWNCFIQSISLDELGPLLPTVVVSMIPLLASCSQEVEAMLEFLLIKNNAKLSMYISEIFFIKDLKVNKRIIRNVFSQIKRSTPTDFDAGLQVWLKRIKHETHEIRFKALCHLQIFLKKHRNELNDMILKDTNVHPLIGELLDALLAGCRDDDESIRSKSGECLGELGAVEPSLRGRRIANSADTPFISSMNDNAFIIAIINELVRAVQMEKSTHNIDSYGLAIQTILKHYGVNPDHIIWGNLTAKCQQIIKPFFESSYKMISPPINSMESPIYGSEAASTFEQWAINWACSIISSIQDQSLSDLIDACRPALKRDVQTTIFWIPYLFTHVVMTGTDNNRQALLKEILAVIKVTKEELDPLLLTWRPLRNSNKVHKDMRISDKARRVRCSQVVFSTLDYVSRWLDEKRNSKSSSEYKIVKEFYGKLDSLELATACYELNDYHRSLMYLERHMKEQTDLASTPTEMGLLAKIYTQLEEPDGVSGILVTQDQSPSLQQLVVAHEVNGQLQDAATCYERLAQRSLEPKYVQGLINCYLCLDQPFTAMKITKGILNQLPEYKQLIESHETFWQLADFQQLDQTHEENVLKNSIVDDLKKGIQPDLLDIKKRLVTQLGTATHEGNYQQNYPYLMKLHILNEFEKASTLMATGDVRRLPEIFTEWEKRDQLIRASRGIEFVMGMRRATLDLAVKLAPEDKKLMLNREIGKIWLKSAKIARKSGLVQQAYMYVLSASDYCPTHKCFIEQAQLYWQKGCQEEAFTTLKRLISSCSDYSTNGESMKNYAKAKLLFAKYTDETLNTDPETNLKYFKEATLVGNGWEKSQLMYAQYLELTGNRLNEINERQGHRQLREAFYNFGKSLQYGCKYVHQSMPKMLSIWMELPQIVPANKQAEIVKDMGVYIENYRIRVPRYVWLSAVTQLVSRILHPQKEIRNTIEDILIDILVEYPQNCLWMLASIFNSNDDRKLTAAKIKSSEKISKNLKQLIEDFSVVWKYLIKVSTHTAKKDYDLSKVNPHFLHLFNTEKFGPIMLPNSKVQLPSKGKYCDGHNPFPNEGISILGIDKKVTVLTSMVKPKKITFKGSDGKEYIFMCKPQDDLRRDSRAMEFNTIVNNYLQKDCESRQRRLYIRTYNVTPLCDSSGLIEWIQNITCYRPIIAKLYKEFGYGPDDNDMKAMINLPDNKKRKLFVETIMPKCPAMFSRWFKLNFPDPYCWYEARAAYIRTTAAMSIVGYILGLGDRHGENILLDEKCGDCVHVDFNCLFKLGEQFKVAERVPFRLTHNMVEAMGPLKYEGPFRKSCETTLRVMRQEASSLISILAPYVYTEKSKESVDHVKDIERRLKGVIKTAGRQSEHVYVNLSVEGQTNHLILDATNIDNLCQMYVGWSAYM